MTNVQRLRDELQAALPEVIGCGRTNRIEEQDRPTTWHKREDDYITVVWMQPPTDAQTRQAEQIVQAHDGTPTVEEKLDAAGLPSLTAALACVMAAQLDGKPPEQWAVDAIRKCAAAADEVAKW